MNNSIKLKIFEGQLFVSFPSDVESKSEYAFYLYKNNIREGVKWYSSSNSAIFDLLGNGTYQAKVFVRNDTGEFIESFLSKSIAYNVPVHDLSRWGRAKIVSMNEFMKLTELANGCLRINIETECVEIFVDGIERLAHQRGALVCFTGAVPKRASKSAPFFSGLNIAKRLNVPVISISDPSLAESKDLALAWYAGNERLKKLPFDIASIFDHIQDILNTRLVLFGGSGGGFAVLSVIEKMKRDASGAIWNPQTSITKYDKNAVANYIDRCFTGFDRNLDFYNCLDSFNISHDLTISYKSCDLATNKKNIIYLQNEGDISHMEHHAKPFMDALFAKKECDNIFSTSHGVCFWFKYWGDGHLVPSQKIIAYALDCLLYGHSPIDIAYRLNKEAHI